MPRKHKKSINYHYIMTDNQLKPSRTDRILCVKVGKIQRENFYEMTRKYWRVNVKRASRATHVLAIVNNKVQAVYRPFRWYLTDSPKYRGRYEFDGTEDTTSEYIGKDVGTLYDSCQNPVRYINL